MPRQPSVAIPRTEPSSSAPSSPLPRRVRRPTWTDPRLVVGVGLLLASVVIGARVVSGAHRTYPVVAVAHDAAVGTVLGPSDLKIMQVQLPNRDVYLTRTEVGIGKQLNRAMSRDELLPRAALGALQSLTRVEVPLAADAAPDLAVGERVTVWLSGPKCAPVLVVSDVVVQRVREAGGSLGSGTGQAIELSVTPEVAQRVLDALSRPDSQLRVGALTGPATPPGDAPLPPIECAAAGPGP